MQQDSPYKGLIPFEESDAPYFFGREKEARLIIAHLFASPLTLLYGATGVGKSSLLRAGVIPQLRERNMHESENSSLYSDLIVIVLQRWQGVPVNRLKEELINSAKNLIKDNFEYSYSDSLYNLIYSLINKNNLRIMIILDQFEEYFLYHPLEDIFDIEFPKILTLDDMPISFLISIREDSLAKLDRFEDSIPMLFDNYLRVEHLDIESGEIVIEKPREKYNLLQKKDTDKIYIEPPLIDTILEEVQINRFFVGEIGLGGIKKEKDLFTEKKKIEAPYLQLVMTHLLQEERSQGSNLLRLETFTKLGGAENIVRTHLDSVMTALSSREQEIAARIFLHLVTPSGTKIAHAAGDLAGYANQPSELITTILEKLSKGDNRIIRPVGVLADRPDEERFEIYHDVLAPSILYWRTQYDLKRHKFELDKARQIASQRKKDSDRFESQKLALESKNIITTDVKKSLKLSYDAIKLNRSKEIEEALRESFVNYQQQTTSILAGNAKSVILPQSSNHKNKYTQMLSVSQGSNNTIYYVAKSPDGKLLATVNHNGELKIWDGEKVWNLLEVSPIQTLKCHDKAIYSAAFSPNKKFIATASQDQTVKVWDLETHKSTATFEHGGDVYGVDISCDGKNLATATSNGTIIVWNLVTKKQRIISKESLSFHRVVFSQDGRLLAATNVYGFASVWEVESGKELHKIMHESSAYGLAFNHDSSMLAVTSESGTVKVWDVATGQILRVFTGHEGSVFGVAFSHDSSMLATMGADAIVKIWSIASGEAVYTLRGHTSFVFWAVFNPEDTHIATVSADETVRVWELPKGHTAAIIGVNFSPDGSKLATSSHDHTAIIWDIASGQIFRRLEGHKGPVYSVIFCHSGTLLGTSGADNTARLWDVESGHMLRQFDEPHKDQIYSLSFSPDDKYLATASKDNTAIIWDVSAGQVVRHFNGAHLDAVFAAIFNHDGTRLATTSMDATAIIWDVESGKPIHTLMGHEKPLLGAAFSHDGTRLATTSMDATAIIWDVESGKPIHTLMGHGREVFAAVFNCNSSRLITTSGDQTAIIWDTDTGTALSILRGHRGAVYRVAISPDDDYIVTTGQDKRVNRQPFKLERLIEEAGLIVGQDSTSDECEKQL